VRTAFSFSSGVRRLPHVRAALFLAVILLFATLSTTGTSQLPSDDLPSEECLTHPPIQITEDHGLQGFTWTNPATGATEPRPGSGVQGGSGTQENPYLIEGLCIPPAPPVAGITITGVDQHVIIRDNLLLGGPASTGVLLDDTSNVILKNNHFFALTTAIHLIDSHQNQIVDNHLELTVHQGILLESSSDNRLTGNRILDTGDPREIEGMALLNGDLIDAEAIRIEGGHSNHLRSNVIRDTTGDAIVIINAHGTTIIVNTVTRSSGTGLVLETASGTLVDFNILQTAHQNGLLATDSPGLTLTNNLIRENERWGAEIIGSPDLTISGNNVAENRVGGIHLEDVNGVQVMGNRLHGIGLTAHSLRASNTSGLIIQDNDVVGSMGIQLIGSSGNTIRENQFSQLIVGLALTDQSDQNYIRDNEFRFCSLGLLIEESHDTLVRANWFLSNIHGARLVDATHNTFDFNAVTGNSIGLQFVGATDNSVIRNQLIHNGDAVQVFPDSPRNLIKDSNIVDNSRYGLLTDSPVDARDNYWGRSSGPSGGVEDGCTSKSANGGGDTIRTLNTSHKVCFSPHRNHFTSSNPSNAPP
jgi:parallel beta-helix repeat protein